MILDFAPWGKGGLSRILAEFQKILPKTSSRSGCCVGERVRMRRRGRLLGGGVHFFTRPDAGGAADRLQDVVILGGGTYIIYPING